MNANDQSADDQPLTKLLYRMSLEPSGRWVMLIGPGLESTPPYLNIGNLRAFVTGFQAALSASSRGPDDGFFLWLRDEASAFPQQGWARFLLDRELGDHEAAIRGLFGYLHRYLLETRPAWFVQWNREPQPSLFMNGLGEALDADVRLSEHVVAATGAPPVAALDLRFSAFEMGDGYVMQVGLPADVGTWWSGSGRRIALMGSKQRLDAIRGSTNSLLALVTSAAGDLGQPPAELCVLDATPKGIDVVCNGASGAVHIHDGQLLARTVSGEVAHWSLERGDRVLLLSGPLFSRAAKLGQEPLPSQLATGEPVAWAQFFDIPGRRLAVSVSRPT